MLMHGNIYSVLCMAYYGQACMSKVRGRVEAF